VSYFLEKLDDDVAARKALTEELPQQRDPWVLDSGGGDAIAYFNVDQGREGETRGPFLIQIDVSGRHYYEDRKVIDILRRLQERLGGINNDEVVR